jgi:hypothetical protein
MLQAKQRQADVRGSQQLKKELEEWASTNKEIPSSSYKH